jgi:hypothetical protein
MRQELNLPLYPTRQEDTSLAGSPLFTRILTSITLFRTGFKQFSQSLGNEKTRLESNLGYSEFTARHISARGR